MTTFCPHCGLVISVKKDGTVRKHTTLHPRLNHKVTCPGTGMPPKVIR